MCDIINAEIFKFIFSLNSIVFFRYVILYVSFLSMLIKLELDSSLAMLLKFSNLKKIWQRFLLVSLKTPFWIGASPWLGSWTVAWPSFFEIRHIGYFKKAEIFGDKEQVATFDISTKVYISQRETWFTTTY